MSVATKRWCDPKEADDGRRVLVCRYRPRGVRKEDESWDTWLPDLGPSRKLHADLYGKNGPPITWTQFRKRYLEEMRSQAERIGDLAAQVAAGAKITLLCSSACTDPAHCHRTLLKTLIDEQLRRYITATADSRNTGSAPARG